MYNVTCIYVQHYIIFLSFRALKQVAMSSLSCYIAYIRLISPAASVVACIMTLNRVRRVTGVSSSLTREKAYDAKY